MLCEGEPVRRIGLLIGLLATSMHAEEPRFAMPDMESDDPNPGDRRQPSRPVPPAKRSSA